MSFFTAKMNEYLATLCFADRIEFLSGYADDAGADGEWHKQHEILRRIESIRAESRADAAAHDAAKKSAHDAAIAAAVRRGNDLIEKGF